MYLHPNVPAVLFLCPYVLRCLSVSLCTCGLISMPFCTALFICTLMYLQSYFYAFCTALFICTLMYLRSYFYALMYCAVYLHPYVPAVYLHPYVPAVFFLCPSVLRCLSAPLCTCGLISMPFCTALFICTLMYLQSYFYAPLFCAVYLHPYVPAVLCPSVLRCLSAPLCWRLFNSLTYAGDNCLYENHFPRSMTHANR